MGDQVWPWSGAAFENQVDILAFSAGVAEVVFAGFGEGEERAVGGGLDGRNAVGEIAVAA